jgi:hypothetical protein
VTTSPFISRLERLASVPSTNDIVAGWLDAGVPEVCVASADVQTAGRGRMGRTWVAPPGAALLASAGFRPAWIELDRAWRIAASVSLAMADAAEDVAGLPDRTILLKWPNDLVVVDPSAADGTLLKLGGVLGEATGMGTSDPRMVVGIGVDAGRPLPTPPPWADPQHPGAGTWPDRDVRLPPMTADEPVPWLEDAAARVRVRVAGCDGPLRIGHLDFETHNMRWHDPADARGTASAGGPGPTLAALRSLDDWDSLGVAPEPLIVGQAAGTFSATRDRFTDPTVAQSAEYVARWLATSGRTWSRDEHELAWAAGLWTKLFNAQDRVVHHDVASVMAHARPDAAERLRLAGA